MNEKINAANVIPHEKLEEARKKRDYEEASKALGIDLSEYGIDADGGTK